MCPHASFVLSVCVCLCVKLDVICCVLYVVIPTSQYFQVLLLRLLRLAAAVLRRIFLWDPRTSKNNSLG